LRVRIREDVRLGLYNGEQVTFQVSVTSYFAKKVTKLELQLLNLKSN